MASILSSCSRSGCAVSGILVVGVGEGGRGWCLMGVLDGGVDPGVLPKGRNVLGASSRSRRSTSSSITIRIRFLLDATGGRLRVQGLREMS